MKNFLSVFILLLGMALVNKLKLDSLIGVENFILLAIGFIVLTAFKIADLGSTWLGLPRVTGYILSGVLLGPHVFKIMNFEVVNELKMFNSLAVGFIAFTAGLELNLNSLRKVAKTIFLTTGLKLLLLPFFVGGSMLLLGTFLPHLFPETYSLKSLYILAAIFSALGIGTSPAITIAITDEMKAKGRMKDIVLGSAIFKDVVVVIVLAIVLAIARNALSPVASGWSTVALHILSELGISLTIGTIFGLLSILYVRFIKNRLLLFILCLILILNVICDLLGADLLLAAIAAGFVIRNFSKFEHDIMLPLNFVSLPTFIVFFTIAGAGIDLKQAASILPIALGLFLARALAFFIAAKIAGTLNNETAAITNKAWLGYLPQAGVTLGLVGLTSSQITDYSLFISELGVTIVSLNLLLGPLCLRFALSKKEETESTSNSLKDLNIEQTQVEIDQSAQESIDAIIDEHVNLTLAKIEEFEQAASKLLDSIKENFTASEAPFEIASSCTKWTEGEISILYSIPTLSDLAQGIDLFFSNISNSKKIFLIPWTTEELAIRLDQGQKTFWRRIFIRFRHIFFTSQKQRKVILKTVLKSSGFYFSRLNLEISQQLLYFKRRIYDEVLTLLNLGNRDLILSSIEAISADIIKKIKEDLKQASKTTKIISANNFKISAGPLDNFSAKKLQKEMAEQVKIANRLTKLKEKEAELLDIFKEEVKFTSVQNQVKLRLNHIVMTSVLTSLKEISDDISTKLVKAKKEIEELKNHIENEELWGNKAANEIRGEIDLQLKKIKNDLTLKEFDRFGRELSLHKISIQIKRLVTLGEGRFRLLSQSFEINQKISIDDIFSFSFIHYGDILQRNLVGELFPEIEECITTMKNAATSSQRIPDRIIGLNEFAYSNEDNSSPSHLKDLLTSGISLSYTILDSQLVEFREIALNCLSQISKKYQEVISNINRESRTPSKKDLLGSRIAKLQRKIRQIPILKPESHFNILLAAIRKTKNQVFAWITSKFRLCKGIIDSIKASKERDSYKEAEKELTTHSSNFIANENILYKKAFKASPLRDKRLFVGREETLSLLCKVANTRQNQAQSAIVIGARRSGLTSLFNMFCLENDVEDLYRLTPTSSKARGNLFKALAAEIGCGENYLTLRRELNRVRRIIIIDDIQKWINPNSTGSATFTTIQDLIGSTFNSTVWIVSATAAFYKQFIGLTPFFHPFKETIILPPLNKDEAKLMITKRLNFSATPRVNFYSGKIASILTKFGIYDSSDTYFSRVTKLNFGNVGDILNSWLKDASLTDDKEILVKNQEVKINSAHFYEKLNPSILAILYALLVYGELTASELALYMHCSEPEIRRDLQFLLCRGQIKTFWSFAEVFSISEHLAPTIEHFFHGEQNGL